jgi:hypothetical protein
MGFLAFYLAGKMHLADAKGHRVSPSLPRRTRPADFVADPRVARAVAVVGEYDGRRLPDGG